MWSYRNKSRSVCKCSKGWTMSLALFVIVFSTIPFLSHFETYSPTFGLFLKEKVYLLWNLNQKLGKNIIDICHISSKLEDDLFCCSLKKVNFCETRVQINPWEYQMRLILWFYCQLHDSALVQSPFSAILFIIWKGWGHI